VVLAVVALSLELGVLVFPVLVLLAVTVSPVKRLLVEVVGLVRLEQMPHHLLVEMAGLVSLIQ
jgi:hypothetical protein